MLPHASKESSRFPKGKSRYLVPYAGSERPMPKPKRGDAGGRTGKTRRKALDSKVIVWLLAEIDAWSGEPLSWEALIGRATLRWGYAWTRQGLAKCMIGDRKVVLEAFQRRQDQLRTSGSRPVASEKKAARRGQATLMAEIEDLRRDVAHLTEKLRIWQKNAFLKGLSLEEFDASWQPVDRHQSDVALRRKLGLPTGSRRWHVLQPVSVLVTTWPSAVAVLLNVICPLVGSGRDRPSEPTWFRGPPRAVEVKGSRSDACACPFAGTSTVVPWRGRIRGSPFAATAPAY